MALLATRQRSQLGVPELAKHYTKDAACWFRDYLTAIKHGRWHPFTNLERKVREATRNEPWGPTGTMLNELAELSMNRADCDIILALIIFRLAYPPVKWRNVYKALTVLEFLIKRGSSQCVDVAQQEIAPRLAQLQQFSYIAPDGKDQGVNVSHRAAAIQALLGDENRLKQERDLYKQRRNTYQGFAREEVPVGAEQPYSSSAGTSANGNQSSTSEATEAQTLGNADFANRSAGEMKGVTMEENRRRVAALKAILERAENRQCADCQASGGAGRPSWASINTGVFICMRCAGIHRGLGVHISKVRSCTLDTWLQSQVDFMDQTGNAVANSHWEGKYDGSQRPSFGPDLEAFIRRKYNGEWSQGTWPPAFSTSTPAPVPASLPEAPIPAAVDSQPGAAPQEQADLLGWDTDDDYQPQPSSSLPHDAFGQQHPSHQNGLPSSMPTFHQQTAAGGPPSAPWAAPVGYPTRPPGSANAGRAGPELMASPAVALQSQAWGSSNAAGLKELQLAPDQSAALQEYVGRSLMDDHMDMAGTGSHLPPAMDISPLTPRAPAEPLAAAGPGFHNALVLYEPLAGRAPLTSVMGGWHQPGIIPSMARFDGPQHQMSFEDSTDFSQPFAAQPWGSQPAYGSATSDPAAFSQSHMQQSQQPGQISMGVAGVPQGSTPAPVTAGGPRLQPQQPQAAVDTAPQESADPLEALLRQAMSNYEVPQPKGAAWLPEPPKEKSLLALKQSQFEAQNSATARPQVSLHSDASGMSFMPPARAYSSATSA
ncbi:hypothetical protein WJX84_000313 [Apatococcus fuscideae]|uniref:Uncharacterized protein n=1 Tax=Apatococcus fuscideae TaxID=2026836 RepID=A0AAW1T6P6_9CHLO